MKSRRALSTPTPQKQGFADEILFDEKKPEPEKTEKKDSPEEPEIPDEEGGDNKPDEKKKDQNTVKLDSDALWQYSTRIMGQTILGKITASAETADTNNTPNDKTDTPQPAEKS